MLHFSAQIQIQKKMKIEMELEFEIRIRIPSPSWQDEVNWVSHVAKVSGKACWLSSQKTLLGFNRRKVSPSLWIVVCGVWTVECAKLTKEKHTRTHTHTVVLMFSTCRSLIKLHGKSSCCRQLGKNTDNFTIHYICGASGVVKVCAMPLRVATD